MGAIVEEFLNSVASKYRGRIYQLSSLLASPYSRMSTNLSDETTSGDAYCWTRATFEALYDHGPCPELCHRIGSSNASSDRNAYPTALWQTNEQATLTQVTARQELVLTNFASW